MTNILVTGSNGQLGQELQTEGKNFSDLELTYTEHQSLDVTDKSQLENSLGEGDYDFCINCAAYTAVNKAEEETDKAYAVNETAVKHLAEICQETGTTLIHPSTDFVFRGEKNTPYHEKDPAQGPKNVYGASKLAGEQQALKLHDQLVIIRTSWVYSPFRSNFVKTMLRLGKEKDRLEVVYDQVGTPTYAKDLAGAILKIIKQLASKPSGSDLYGIYHYSNEGVVSWYDFARAVMDLGGLDCHISPIETKDFPQPADRPAYTVLNKAKIKETFGFSIPYWRHSLEKCLKRL